MAAIHVCPLSRLAETLAATGAGTVVSLLTGPSQALPAMAGKRHLVLDVADIAVAQPGYTLAGEAHIMTLLDVVRTWDRSAPLLIHCFAGVSRSPAAAFAAACLLRPDAEAASIARELRRAAPSATPNPRLVALADAALGRRGRMIAAIDAIGRGQDCFEGEVFRLEMPALPFSGGRKKDF